MIGSNGASLERTRKPTQVCQNLRDHRTGNRLLSGSRSLVRKIGQSHLPPNPTPAETPPNTRFRSTVIRFTTTSTHYGLDSRNNPPGPRSHTSRLSVNAQPPCRIIIPKSAAIRRRPREAG